jgi:hypothetical protein
LRLKQPLVSDQILKNLASEVRSIWDEKAIPSEQRAVFMDSLEGLPKRKKAVAIAKHIDELINNKAMVQYVLRTISARDKALKKLQGLCEFVTQAESIEDSAVQQSIDLLSALRLLSLNVVECIVAWREQLAATNPTDLKLKKAAFVHGGQSYLLKMKQDIDFVKTSPFSQLFSFTEGPDPFLKAAARSKRIRAKLDLPIPYALKARINKAEFLIIEEASAQQASISVLPRPNPSSRRSARNKLSPVTSPSLDKARASSQGILQQDNGHEKQTHKRIDLITEKLELKADEASAHSVDDIEVEGVDGDVEAAIERYMQGVAVEIRETFGDGKATYASVMKGPYPCLLWMKQSKQVVGLLGLNIDTQSMLSKRLIVNHFSCVDPQHLADLLKGALGYLWHTYPADEVRVALAYRDTEGGKYEIDETIKARFDEVGFKWRNLTNTGDGKRLLLMGLKRPEGQLCADTGLALMFQETIVLSLATVVACTAEETSEQGGLSGQSCVVTLLAALNQLPLKETPTPGPIDSLLKKTAESFKFPAIKAVSSHDAAEALQLPAAQNFQFSLPLLTIQTAAAVASVGFTWLKFTPVKLQVKGKTFAYNYIRESEISIAEAGSRQVYIVPIDRAFSVFIIPGPLEGDLFSEVQRVVQSITKVVGVKDSILIPSFKLSRRSSITGVTVALQDLAVTAALEEFSVELRTSFHPRGSQPKAPESVLQVEGEFVFGLMHSMLEEKLELPYFAARVTPEDWTELN